MAVSYPVFFALYILSMIVAIFVGLLITVGWKDIWIRKSLSSARYNIIYLIILTSFPLVIYVQDVLQGRFTSPDPSKTITYTNWIFKLAGGVLGVLQDRLNYGIVTDSLIIVYVWLFTFLLYFAPTLLIVRDDRATIRKYAVAMMLNYIVLIFFYTIFPVSVSGAHAGSGITPILYVNNYWGRMVTSIDPLDNGFPSGHVSIAVTTFLVFAYAGPRYRKFTYFLIGATVGTTFAVLDLGIHWPADVFAGFILGVGATVLAGKPRIQMTFDRWVRRISRRIVGEEKADNALPGGAETTPQQR